VLAAEFLTPGLVDLGDIDPAWGRYPRPEDSLDNGRAHLASANNADFFDF